MLAVIGLNVCFETVKDIDAFDYHLYRRQPIVLHACLPASAFSKAGALLDGLLAQNHLSRSDAHLILLSNRTSPSRAQQTLGAGLASVRLRPCVNDALDCAQITSQQYDAPVLILSLNENAEDGLAAVLVCDRQVVTKHAQMKACFQYACITATASCDVFTGSEQLQGDHIEAFLSANHLSPQEIDSIVLAKSSSPLNKQQHQSLWLMGFQQATSTKSEPLTPATLLTEVDLIESNSKNNDQHFDGLLSLMSAILCLDQRYRLGAGQVDTVPSEWQSAGCYYLEEATSYLSAKATEPEQVSTRHMIVSQLSAQQTNKKHHYLLITNAVDTINSKTDTAKNQVTFQGGFLAQQSAKPVIFYAQDLELLLTTLRLAQTDIERAALSSFSAFSEQQYHAYHRAIKAGSCHQSDYYCVVLIASSFATLNTQLQLAITGIPVANENQQAWKTPAGSYFSGRLVACDQRLPVSFIYPGVGALYVGMGKDLLRLFPACYEQLALITDDLAYSFQDCLMTPRLSEQPDAAMHAKFEALLRAELANIAEAGVSYACLLTTIFQDQLSVNAASAAGYSMGEVSMFAALSCWKTPQLLGQRLRQSAIFTEQLSGPLKRLQGCWETEYTAHAKQWESYYLKAGLMQVESVLPEFNKVFVTIINTAESLVIAGDPSQCLALAKRLSIRAIPLDVHNIIHCPLAKSEYDNMKALYALPVKSSVNAKLFSSSCYLPVPVTENAIAVSISQCLTEQVDFPRLIEAMHGAAYPTKNDHHVFIEMGAGKSLSTWIDRILHKQPVTCLSVDQRNLDDYSGILKTIAPLISLGHPINLQSFFTGSLVRSVNKVASTVLVS